MEQLTYEEVHNLKPLDKMDALSRRWEWLREERRKDKKNVQSLRCFEWRIKQWKQSFTEGLKGKLSPLKKDSQVVDTHQG